jgi:hypothetical protein
MLRTITASTPSASISASHVRGAPRRSTSSVSFDDAAAAGVALRAQADRERQRIHRPGGGRRRYRRITPPDARDGLRAPPEALVRVSSLPLSPIPPCRRAVLRRVREPDLATARGRDYGTKRGLRKWSAPTGTVAIRRRVIVRATIYFGPA